MADTSAAPLDAEAAAKAAFAAAQSKQFPSDIFAAPQLRWAVIGCGVIANQMAESLALAGRALAGVQNRTLAKAEAFAAAHGVARVYGSLEELCSDPDIDAVYQHLALIRVVKPRNQLYQAGFCTSCSADNSHRFSGTDC